MATNKSKNIPQEVFTTFDAAKICNANFNSIKNWIHQGKLRAYKTPGGHYRIQKQDLRSFLHDHGMPDPFEPTQKSILILDDNQDVIDNMELLLAEYKCQGVTDGYDALVQIGREPPDIVLIDVYMPDLDGFEVIRRLREKDFLTKTHIIAYSGADEPDLADRTIEAGAHAFWPKGGDVAVLIRVIEELLDGTYAPPARRKA